MAGSCTGQRHSLMTHWRIGLRIRTFAMRSSQPIPIPSPLLSVQFTVSTCPGLLFTYSRLCPLLAFTTSGSGTLLSPNPLMSAPLFSSASPNSSAKISGALTSARCVAHVLVGDVRLVIRNKCLETPDLAKCEGSNCSK